MHFGAALMDFGAEIPQGRRLGFVPRTVEPLSRQRHPFQDHNESATRPQGEGGDSLALYALRIVLYTMLKVLAILVRTSLPHIELGSSTLATFLAKPLPRSRKTTTDCVLLLKTYDE